MNISFLMAYRSRIETDKALEKMLASFNQFYPEEELLIRIDSDDLRGKAIINEYQQKYKFIRKFVHNRWEGLYTIYLDYQYLFTQKDSYTKYVGFLTDGCYFIRNISNELDNKYLIFGDFKSEMNKEKLNKEPNWTPEYICAYPIVSSHLLEIMGNTGYQHNIDSHLALINFFMYRQNKVILAKHIPEFIIRDNVDRTEDYGHNITKRWQVSDTDMPTDLYFYALMNQTIKNIYLNMQDEKKL